MVTLESILLLANAVFAFIEFIIGLRIILKLFGANPAAPFAQWVYETSQPLIAPFLGMFPSPRLSGGFIVEISTLFALLVYAFAAYAISELVAYLGTRKTVIVSKNRKTTS